MCVCACVCVCLCVSRRCENYSVSISEYILGEYNCLINFSLGAYKLEGSAKLKLFSEFDVCLSVHRSISAEKKTS